MSLVRNHGVGRNTHRFRQDLVETDWLGYWLCTANFFWPRFWQYVRLSYWRSEIIRPFVLAEILLRRVVLTALISRIRLHLVCFGSHFWWNTIFQKLWVKFARVFPKLCHIKPLPINLTLDKDFQFGVWHFLARPDKVCSRDGLTVKRTGLMDFSVFLEAPIAEVLSTLPAHDWIVHHKSAFFAAVKLRVYLIWVQYLVDLETVHFFKFYIKNI